MYICNNDELLGIIQTLERKMKKKKKLIVLGRKNVTKIAVGQGLCGNGSGGTMVARNAPPHVISPGLQGSSYEH